jgi:hypothetical protein
MINNFSGFDIAQYQMQALCYQSTVVQYDVRAAKSARTA